MYKNSTSILSVLTIVVVLYIIYLAIDGRLLIYFFHDERLIISQILGAGINSMCLEEIL